MHRLVLVAALGTVAASPAAAQQLTLSFNHGQVSVDATSVPARAILDEWSRVGGTKVINGDRLGGPALTLKLVNVPESRALEIILRTASGYMAAPRGQTAGASMYDRILVMPSSSAPAAASGRAGLPPPPGGAPGTQRFVPPRMVPPAEAAPEGESAEEEVAPAQPVFTFPDPAQGGFRPGARPQQGAGAGASTPEQAAPETSGTPGTPTSGPMVGAPVPGMILQPARPGQPRPPGH